MRLLVLGGTRFVGRAVVRNALERGWEVTALHRGVTGALPAGVTVLRADRTSAPAMSAALGDGRWDLVVDTWSGAPAVAGTAARLLRGRAHRFGFVSSMSVYARGSHVDEHSPLVDGDARADRGDSAGVTPEGRQVRSMQRAAGHGRPAVAPPFTGTGRDGISWVRAAEPPLTRFRGPERRSSQLRGTEQRRNGGRRGTAQGTRAIVPATRVVAAHPVTA